jgi:exonuclease SbcD
VLDVRIIHTADWHLGRSLFGVDLLEHQAAYLDHLVELVDDVQPAAVLVSGDVYDRGIPPVEAVNLLSNTLARLADRTHVVLTPGNHDSASRLGFGAKVMRETVHVRTQVEGLASPVMVPGADGNLAVYALPYLDPDDARVRLANDPAEPLHRSHEAVTTAALARVTTDLATRRAIDPGLRAVLIAHLFAVGGAPSGSERDIRVGGVDGVPAGVFAATGLDYVALGHLHGPQRISVPNAERPLARYSGSPLAYSFAEKQHVKSTTVVDLDTLHTELVPAPVPRRLTELHGTLADLLADREHTLDWVHVTVVDKSRPPGLMATIKEHFPYALHVSFEPAHTASRSRSLEITTAHQPFDVTARFIEHVTGDAPGNAERSVLHDVVQKVLTEQRND